MTGITDLDFLLTHLRPILDPGSYVFDLLPAGSPVPPEAWAMIREAEGITVIREVEGDGAQEHAGHRFRRITLEVHSSLLSVGLTAAVSRALAEAGIPANVVAGYHHDHVFVPAGRADHARAVLEALGAASVAPRQGQ